jgi:hypothetical protein
MLMAMAERAFWLSSIDTMVSMEIEFFSKKRGKQNKNKRK